MAEALKEMMTVGHPWPTVVSPDSVDDSAENADMELRTEALGCVARSQAALAKTSGTIRDVTSLIAILSGNLYLLAEDVRDEPSLYNKTRSVHNAAERAVS